MKGRFISFVEIVIARPLKQGLGTRFGIQPAESKSLRLSVEEMSTEETAMHLSVKPETVKTRFYRARRLMRAALDKRPSSAFSELFLFDGARSRLSVSRASDRPPE